MMGIQNCMPLLYLIRLLLFRHFEIGWPRAHHPAACLPCAEITRLIGELRLISHMQLKTDQPGCNI